MNRLSFSVVVFAVIIVVALVVGGLTNWFFGLAAFVAFAGSLVKQGFVNIPNDPPQKGVLTIFGERKSVVMDEGWTFLPLNPIVFGYIGVEVTRVTEKFAVKVTTPDLADSDVPIEITYLPLNKFPDVTDGLIRFLNNIGRVGVSSQLTGKIDERVREWGMADEEGPQTWEELKKSRLEAVSVLTKTIGFNHVAEIPSYAQKVPTVIWMRYFTEPRPEKAAFESEKEWIGKDGKWQRVEDVIRAFSGDSTERERMKKELKEAVTKRRNEVRALRAGSGKIFLDDLGVVIERLNVGEIKALGEVARAAEKKAKEIQEMRGDELELKNVRERIAELMDSENGPGYSKEQALEVVQTERGKVTKTIAETKISISSEVQEMLKEILPSALSIITGKKGGVA